MNKKTLQKIESQLQEQKKIPSDKKEVIRTEIFYNISLAIMIMGYFFLLIYQLSDKSFDYKICSTIMLLFTISIFEVAYKSKDLSGKIALFGIEILGVALATLFMPYIVFETTKRYDVYFLVVPIFVVIYYSIKSIILYRIAKKQYLKSISDVKDIIKKEVKNYD